MFYWSAVAFIALAAVAFVAAAAIVLVGRRRPMIWVAPVVGSVITLVTAFIAYRLGSIALGL